MLISPESSLIGDDDEILGYINAVQPLIARNTRVVTATTGWSVVVGEAEQIRSFKWSNESVVLERSHTIKVTKE